MLVRYGTALLAVLLVLLLAVRPLIGKWKGKAAPPASAAAGDAVAADGAEGENTQAEELASDAAAQDIGTPLGDLPRQVELARRLAASQPDRAVEALQRMLEAPETRPAEAGAA